MSSSLLNKISNLKPGDTFTVCSGGMKESEIEALRRLIKAGTIRLDPYWLNTEIAPHAIEKYEKGDAIAIFMKYIRS